MKTKAEEYFDNTGIPCDSYLTRERVINMLAGFATQQVNLLNKPAVSKREGVICEHPMQDRYYTYADTYWCTNCERVIIDSEFKQPVGGGSVCGDCWGSGWERQFIEPCKKCNGTGKI